MPVCGKCLHSPEPLIAEFFCKTCHAPFINRFPLDENGNCMLCRLGLNGFDSVYAFGSYEGNLRELIHLLKYNGMTPLSVPLGEMLRSVVPPEQRFDCVVAVPMHWRRRWSRGFNQSELLARQIAKRWNIPLRPLLRRRKATSPQVRLSNAKRRANLAGAFAFRGKLPANARVLLVDDVVTTGATAAACARVLKRAGAAHVALATVARTDRRFVHGEVAAPAARMAGV